jgi:hypothetical protein
MARMLSAYNVLQGLFSVIGWISLGRLKARTIS